MHISSWAQIFLFALILFGLIPLLGTYIANVVQNKVTVLHPLLQWLEKLTYRVSGVNPTEEMSWKNYAKTMLLFNFFGFLMLMFLQLMQYFLPLNPENFPGVSWPLAFNTAISFVTNTNWQAYSGETTLSYNSQMLGLTVQNFLSAATGMAVLLALIRGIKRKTMETIGNFWSDLVKTIIYIFLPLSLILAVVLVSQGAIQTFGSYVDVETLEKGSQKIPLGPVASQVAIKQLGTNGGGFFNANSAHPFENPTALSNFLEMLALVLIPAATVYTYGLLIGSKKHAWLLLGVMSFFWVVAIAISFYSEYFGDPFLGVGLNLEGKETRLGITDSLIWSVSTTSTANGSVNCLLDSLSPLAGGVAMFNIMLGELIFGGVGVGLCSMLMFVLLTVFLSGLMVGRNPEYQGKKIEKREIQWVMVAILTPAALTLIGAGIASILPEALSGLGNQGPHGLSEILYAFASCAGNNGSAFAGLNANINFFNLSLGFVMLLGRLAILIPSLAIAGLLVRKKISPATAGTFSTETLLFFVLLASIILIVGALTFFPALALGPIVEHFLMLRSEVN